jgi:hypothetical protein
MLQHVREGRPGADIAKLPKSGGVTNHIAKYQQCSPIQKTRVNKTPAFHLLSVQTVIVHVPGWVVNLHSRIHGLHNVSRGSEVRY